MDAYMRKSFGHRYIPDKLQQFADCSEYAF